LSGTKTVGTHNICSGADIPPTTLVIRAVQHTINTTKTFVDDNAAVQD